jgi:hypothetical protein
MSILGVLQTRRRSGSIPALLSACNLQRSRVCAAIQIVAPNQRAEGWTPAKSLHDSDGGTSLSSISSSDCCFCATLDETRICTHVDARALMVANQARPMRVHDSVAFITGANRGLGLMFAKEDMAGEFTLPKVKPVDVVGQVRSAIEAGRNEVLVDDLSRAVKARQGTIADLGRALRSATSTLLSGDLP